MFFASERGQGRAALFAARRSESLTPRRGEYAVEWLCAQHFRAQSRDDKAVSFALQVGPFFEQKTGPFPRAPRHSGSGLRHSGPAWSARSSREHRSWPENRRAEQRLSIVRHNGFLQMLWRLLEHPSRKGLVESVRRCNVSTLMRKYMQCLREHLTTLILQRLDNGSIDKDVVFNCSIPDDCWSHRDTNSMLIRWR